MVVWVFAGGGETEIKGFIPFLEKHFGCHFIRKAPIKQKPGPRPTRGESPKKKEYSIGYGKTGQSLAEQIRIQLENAFLTHDTCDLILVLDDLDCHDEQQREQMFIEVTDRFPQTMNIPKFVAFASPEIEAWIIADWDNSLAKHLDFREKHEAMRWWLSSKRAVSFSQPENFSEYDSYKNACKEKLSEAIIEASIEYAQERIVIDEDGKPSAKYDVRYSKGIHTPALLGQINADIVSNKCPLFKKLFIFLSAFCSSQQ